MSNNKINQLEKNDSNQYQQIDNFFLLTIKLKNVFDRFYKKWTEISYKTSEGITKYTRCRQRIIERGKENNILKDRIFCKRKIH